MWFLSLHPIYGVEEIPKELLDKVCEKLVLLWAERIPQLGTLDEVEEQERLMAVEIIRLVLAYDRGGER